MYRGNGSTDHIGRALAPGAEVELFSPLDIFERDGWTCQLCGHTVADLLLSGRHPLAASLDHIVPVSLGGGHTRANTQTVHFSCNSRKGARYPWTSAPPPPQLTLAWIDGYVARLQAHVDALQRGDVDRAPVRAPVVVGVDGSVTHVQEHRPSDG